MRPRNRRDRVRCGEHGAAEILFQAIGDVVPQRGHFGGAAAVGIDFHDRATVDHRGGVVGAVMKRDRCHGAVLAQRDRGFGGDLGLWGRRVDDEDQRFAGAFAEVHGRADGTQVVRAGACGNHDQFGHADDRLDRHGDGWRRVDHRQFEALLAQNQEIAREPGDGSLRERRVFRLALVPPVGERALRVDVDQHNRPGTGALRLYREMARQRRLARSALLRSQCQYSHRLVPLFVSPPAEAVRETGSQDTPNFGLTSFRLHRSDKPGKLETLC